MKRPKKHTSPGYQRWRGITRSIGQWVAFEHWATYVLLAAGAYPDDLVDTWELESVYVSWSAQSGLGHGL